MSLIALQGITDQNKSIELSNTFDIGLSDDSYNQIPSQQGDIIKDFSWYVETPTGELIEIINNVSNRTLTISNIPIVFLRIYIV